MADLRQSLRDALRKVCHNTSVEQLRKSGVRQVNVLGLDRVVSLVQQAVYHSLRDRLMGLDRKQAADATKAEFLRLLQTNQQLSEDREKLQQVSERAEAEVLQLRRELNEQRHALREKLEDAARLRSAGTEEDDGMIAARLAELFRTVDGASDAGAAVLEDRVRELVLEIVRAERQTALDAKEELHRREVDLLQRRIAKVNQALGETERQLANVVAAKSEDPGVASVYRTVQGVSPDDAKYQRKKELVREIFRANLALQKRSHS